MPIEFTVKQPEWLKVAGLGAVESCFLLVVTFVDQDPKLEGRVQRLPGRHARHFHDGRVVRARGWTHSFPGGDAGTAHLPFVQVTCR